MKGQLRSVIQSCGFDQEGKRLSWETGIEEVGFEVLLKDVTEGQKWGMKDLSLGVLCLVFPKEMCGWISTLR